MTIRTIGLIGCGKSKLPHRAPAKEIYTGQLFRMACAYVEATCDQWAILSARHGLVMPDRLLDPYEQRVPHNREERARWARNIHQQILMRWCQEAMPPGPEDDWGGRPPVWRPELLQVRFVVLAGADYRDAMAPAGWDTPLPFDAPLAALGIGQQLGWLKGALDGLRSTGQAGGGTGLPGAEWAAGEAPRVGGQPRDEPEGLEEAGESAAGAEVAA